MKQITSRNNPLVKYVVALHSAAGRKAERKFLAEGVRTISTLINADVTLYQLYVTDALYTKAYTLSKDAILVSEQVMEKMSTVKTPSGILAVFKQPSTPEKIGPGLVLAHLQDPGNVGTLIRTAAALGKQTVVVIDGVDPWGPKVVQASAGTVGMVNIIKKTWDELAHTQERPPLVGMVVKDGKSPREVDLKHALLVVGSEARGLSAEQRAACDNLVTLPMPGQTESLNAAVAGSIALYLGTLS